MAARILIEVPDFALFSIFADYATVPKSGLRHQDSYQQRHGPA
jgi:hypothetical protein